MNEQATESIFEKRERLTMLERREKLRREFGLMFYEPHKKQDLFHRAGILKSRYARTGNRFGKSLMGAAEDCAWALGYRPWYQRTFNVRDFDGSIFRLHEGYEDHPYVSVGLPERNVKGLIIVADWDKAHEIFTNQEDGEAKGKLFKLLPHDKIEDVITNKGLVTGVVVKSKWGGVSTIYLDTIKSFKSNKMGQESGDWDFIHVDEPCPKDMYIANARGLIDRDGSDWFTCTPISEMWINDKFLPSGNFRDSFDESRTFRTFYDGIPLESWIITGSMHDNPTTTAAAKARFISTLTEQEREARVSGRPLMLAGVVYKEFEPETHLFRETPKGWSDYASPPLDYCIRIGIDTHPTTPHAVLFAATSPSGYTYFWSEIFEQCFIKDLCKTIYSRLDGRWPNRVLLELAAYNDNPIDGITMADEFIDAGLPVEPAVKDPMFGIQRVQQELAKRDSRGNPYMLFSQHLTETLREFDRYCWDTEKGKPYDRDDHMMENLYRMVLTGLQYVEPDSRINALVRPTNIETMAKAATKLQPDFRLDAFDHRKKKVNLLNRFRRDYRVTNAEERTLADRNSRYRI